LQLSHATAPPETWERAADVTAGVAEVTVTVAADGGSRLRLVTTAADGALRYSNLVLVVDQARVLYRPGMSQPHTPTTRPGELFSDPRLAEKFFADLATLRSGLPSPAPRPSAASSSEQSRATAAIDRGDWARYLDECAGRIGHPLLRFALGLPAAADDTDSRYEALLPVSWDEQLTDDTEAGLDDDSAEAVTEERADQPAPLPPAPPDLRRADEATRRRYRRWAERLADAAPQLGTPERLLVTRLLLWTAAAGAWDHDDHSWLKLLAEALRALAKADLPAEAEPQVASLAAVALSVLRSQEPRYRHTRETMAYEDSARAVAHLLPATDGTYIDEYRQLLDTAFGSAVDPETVQTLAAEVVQADPIADAVWALAELGRDAHRHGVRMLHVTGKFGNPLLAALEAAGAAQDAELVGAWATSASGAWALCLWQRPDLVTIDASGPRPLWRHYRLTGLLTPQVLAAQKSFEGAATVRHGPFVQPFPEAIAMLRNLGLSSPAPPDDCPASQP